MLHSHKDAALCDELRTRLTGFSREGRAQFWCDRAVDAGAQWHPEIMQALEAADIAILMLSPDFYASDFIWKQELPRAKQRWSEGKLTVISIRVRASYDPKVPLYQWLRDEQQVPRDERAVTSLPNRDEAWREVMIEIDRTIERILEQRESGIAKRGEVDVALADAAVALKAAFEAVRQVPDNVGGVSRDEIESALTGTKAALGSDTTALRDEVASAYSRLRRCKFARDENARLSQALADLRDQLMAVFEVAGSAGFTSHAPIGIPQPRLIPQSEVAEARSLVETRLGELEVRVKELERHREGTVEAAVTDAAIDQVVEGVKEQTGLARELLSEPEVDVAGVDAAIEGAARVVGRFVRRAIGFGSTAVRAIAAGLEAAAGVLVRTGKTLTQAITFEGGTRLKSAGTGAAQAEVRIDAAMERAEDEAGVNVAQTLDEEALLSDRSATAVANVEEDQKLTQELAQLMADSIAQYQANKGRSGTPTNAELTSLADLVSAAAAQRTIAPAFKDGLASTPNSAADSRAKTPAFVSGDPVARLSRALDPTTASAIWSRFRAGQRGIMVRAIYSPEGRIAFDQISQRYGHDADFGRAVNRFLSDFERLVRDIEQQSPRAVHGHLVSDAGRVYLFLAHASGRLR